MRKIAKTQVRAVTIGLIITLGFISPLHAQLSPDNNFTYRKANDPAMAAAIAKARASIQTFWDNLENPKSGVDGFAIKVGLPTRSGELEHIWVGNIKRQGELIIGLLDNDPRDLEGLKAGSSVTFKSEQISDWLFIRKGKMVGNETARVLIATLPPAEAAKLRAMFETP
jgi:uncharacterized protein YegJ (DUF2314 family)